MTKLIPSYYTIIMRITLISMELLFNQNTISQKHFFCKVLQEHFITI